MLGVAGLINILFFAYPAPLLGAATRGGEVVVLTRLRSANREPVSERSHREMNRDATGLAGVRHIAFDTLGSTNAEALALARAGERGPLWISAQSQSAGRGRRGSTWVSPAGNLYATLLLTEPSPPAAAPQLSFVAALALHDAVAECAPQLGPLLEGEMAERSAARHGESSPAS